MKNALSLAIFALFSLSAGARTTVDSVRIYFRQSHADIDTAYMNNGRNLNKMADRHSFDKDSIRSITHIHVAGSASPEGNVRINRTLSEKRARKIFDYFKYNDSITTPTVSFVYTGRDWKGLMAMAKNDPDLPYRDDVISMINEIITSISEKEYDTEENLARLKNLHNGTPYRYMYNRMFPFLRESRLYVTYDVKGPEREPLPLIPPVGIMTVAKPIPLTIQTIPTLYKEKCRHPFYMDISTNMLYDILALPNIAAEFYVGKNWSVKADWIYGWWDIDPEHRYWRAYGGNVGVRRWFGKEAAKKPLTGHHLGISAGIITYDFEFGGRGYMGGLPGKTLWDRFNYTADIEYGYSLPIARRLNLDFTIGIGYLGGKVINYVPSGKNYVYQSTKMLNWFGPTKAEISLVWLIGCDNYNRGKGEER